MSKEKSKALQAEIANTLTRLSELTDDAAKSEAMAEYFAFSAKFHQYSMNNQFLIAIGFPGATHVAGYKKWTEFGRFVRKGEKGIPILAPMIVNKKHPEDEDRKVTVCVGFRVVYVFDVSQTDGDDLPETPEWKSPERQEELQAKLIAFATSKDITVKTDDLGGGIQGASFGGVIVLDEGAGTKTLIHEIAHELLHQNGNGNGTGKQDREVEAESVAFIVGTHFGLDNLSSPNYLALWNADSKIIAARANNIQKVAHQIISAVEAGNA